MHLARNYDSGHLSCVLQDEDDTEAICMRVSGVRALDEGSLVEHGP